MSPGGHPHRHWEKLGEFDGLTIDGVRYRVQRSDPDGQLLREVERPTVTAHYDHGSWAKVRNQVGFRLEPGLHQPNRSTIRSIAGVEFVGDIPSDQRLRMRFYETMIIELEKLRRAGKVKLRPADVQQQIDGELGRTVHKMLRDNQLGKGALGGRGFVSFTISGSALLKKRRDYLKHGFAGLRDGRYRSGNPRSGLQPDVTALVALHVRQNMTASIRQLHEDIVDEIEERNAAAAHRAAAAAAAGDPDFEPTEMLRAPDIKTIARAKSKLDPFRVAIAKWGRDAAVRMQPAVRGSADGQEALERVEYDESVVDVMVLLTESGVWALMTDKERAQVKRGRMVIGIAICAITRCIVAMRIYPVGNAEEAVATIRMITEDKTKYIPPHLRGKLSWHQFGGIGGFVVDQGSSNISEETRTCLANLGVLMDVAPAAHPEDRGVGERIFRSLGSEVYSLLDARTGSNVVERLQYRPDGRESLTIDELWRVLVLGIVGIYHTSPHAGLGGRTPLDEWERVTAAYGVKALPDPNRRRVAFGRHRSRKVTRYGVTYGGLSYTNPLLDHHYLHGRGNVEVVGDPEDLGAVSTRIGDAWYEALCVDREMTNVRLDDWLAAAATQKDIASDDVRKRRAARRAAKAALRAIQDSARSRASERPQVDYDRLEEIAVKQIFGKYEHAEADQPIHNGQLGIDVEPDNEIVPAPAPPPRPEGSPVHAATERPATKGAKRWKMSK